MGVVLVCLGIIIKASQTPVTQTQISPSSEPVYYQEAPTLCNVDNVTLTVSAVLDAKSSASDSQQILGIAFTLIGQVIQKQLK